MANNVNVDELDAKSMMVLLYHEFHDFKAEMKEEMKEMRNDLAGLDKRVAVIESRSENNGAIFFGILAVLTVSMPVVCVLLQHWLTKA
jgi:hypothetical protein